MTQVNEGRHEPRGMRKQVKQETFWWLAKCRLRPFVQGMG